MHRGEQAGTDSLLALSWMTWGDSVADHPISETTPAEGDVVIFRRRDSTYQGHVGFYIAHNRKGNRILVLGGNQSDGVCYKWFPLKGKTLEVIGYRRGV